MKVAYASDIHLSFGFLDGLDLSAFDSEADTLILAGDVIEADWFKRCRNSERLDTKTKAKYNDLVEFYTYLSKTYKNVIYVMGNHEHYGCEFSKTPKYITEFLSANNLNNVHLLDNQTIDIEGVTFFGATSWTDMGHPRVDFYTAQRMNDFRHIRKEGRGGKYSRFSPNCAREEHAKTLTVVRELSRKVEGKWVFVMHHAPSFESIPEYYKQDSLSCAYYSTIMDKELHGCGDMTNLPDLVIHGHVHSKHDYYIDDVRVVCNPRGYYQHEKISQAFTVKVVEV